MCCLSTSIDKYNYVAHSIIYNRGIHTIVLVRNDDNTVAYQTNNTNVIIVNQLYFLCSSLLFLLQ